MVTASSTVVSRMHALVDDLLHERARILDAGLTSYQLLQEACTDPRGVQTELLRAIVSEARETEFGRAHGFAGIDSLDSFRRQVPIHSYDDLRPSIERMSRGEHDILIAGDPIFFAQTSGTTGAPKLVPYSWRAEYEYMPFVLPNFGAVERDCPGAIAGRQIILSRFIEGETPAGIPVGSASGFARNMQEHVPDMLRVPGIVFDEHRAELRYYAMLLYMLSQPLVWLSALNPSTILTFLDRLDTFASSLALDLTTGSWAHGPSGVDALMRAAARPLTPAPERAARIRECLAAHGRIHLEQVCPELRVVTTWRGGNAKHYIGQLRARLPTCDIRSEVSGSSETALLTPMDRDTDGGVPALFSTVMEFVTAESSPSAPTFHDIEALQPGQGYRLVVTNRRGMYRLLMEDVFFVERHVERTPVLRFSHRHGLQSSLTGEKLTEWHIIEAVAAAGSGTGLQILDYQAGPEWGNPPGYLLLLEVDDPDETRLRDFLSSFERTLSELNLEYAAKRQSRRLAPPSLVALPGGHLRRRQQRELASAGRSDAQAKIPRLRRDLVTPPADHRRIVLDNPEGLSPLRKGPS